MALDDFADALAQGFLRPVSGRRPVEGVDRVKPVERDPYRLAAREVAGAGPLQRQVFEDGAGRFQVRGGVVNRRGNHFEGQRRLGEFAPGGRDKIGRITGEAKEAEALGQFHDGAGLGLFGRGAFAHLLPGPGQRGGIPAAVTEKNRDAQAPGVDPDGAIEDVEVELLEFGLQAPHRFGRGEDLVLVMRVCFEGIL